MNKLVVLPGLTALGVVAGIASSGIIANAATTTQTTATSSSQQTTADQNAPQTPRGPHQYNGQTETVLTGNDLTKATDAAKTKYPNATVDRAETDADGDGTYEVHMKNSDGSMVTVFLDSSFNVTSTANGMSNKNPGPQGGHKDDTTSSTAQTN